MTTSKLQHAEKQTVFVLDYSSEIPSVEETNYLEFIERFADKTTTPRGVGKRLFIRERNNVIIRVETEKATNHQRNKVEEADEVHSKGWRFELFIEFLNISDLEEMFNEIINEEDYVYEDDENTYRYFEVYIYEAMTWGVRGNNLASLEDYFLTEIEAENQKLEWLEYDYENATDYEPCFDTKEEAENEIIEFLKEKWGVSEKTVKSILKWQERKEQIEYEMMKKSEENRLKKQAEQEQEFNLKYSELIENTMKIEKEKYKETCLRLSVILNKKIKGSDFHKIVKQIRNK